MKEKYFLTVDWCNQGKRGIFCSDDGTAFFRETPYTEDDFWNILDAFSMVLSPKSEKLNEDEIKKYTQWYPLAEFSNRYGYATKKLESLI